MWYRLDESSGNLEISTTKDRQKYRNLRRDPHVAMSILDPENSYRYLEVRGRVVTVEDDPDDRLIDALATRYMDVDEYPYKQPGEVRVRIVIEPDRANTMG